MSFDKRKFWTPVIVGLVLGTMSAFVVLRLMPVFSGNVNDLLLAVLFAPAAVVAFPFGSHFMFSVLSVLQFPLYGLRIGLSHSRGELGPEIQALVIVHGLLASLCYFLSVSVVT